MARILVLDDSASLLALVASWLTEAGHHVVTRSSGAHIDRLLRTTAFDVIVTDIYMPDVDGIELLGVVRTTYPSLPCIAMSSAEGDMNLLNMARVLGARVTLRKPFTAEELHAAIATALRTPASVPTPSRSSTPAPSS